MRRPFLVLLVFTVTCKFSFGQTGTSIAFNRDHFNKRLDGYELQLLSNTSLHACVKECMVTFQCKSINSHRSAAICELNWVDTGDVDTSALMPNASWNFYEINIWPPELAGQCRVNTCPRAHGCSQYMSGPSCYPYVIPECVTVHNDEGGTIKNKNFPNGFPDSSCSWELNAPDGKTFVLDFVNVNFENSTDCVHNFVTVYDGSNKTDPELGKVCGSTQVDQPFMSTSNTMLVTMDSRMSVSYAGFEARYELGCNEMFNGAKGTIDKSYSVFTFQKYCSWQVTVGPSYSVVLGFLSLTLGTISCEQGPLTIHDGRYSNDETIATTCSQSRIEATAVVSTGDTLLINISTDVLANGFSGKFYSAIRADSLVGVVQSPNYPMPYYHNDMKSWYLSVPSGHFVVLTFIELEMEPTTINCVHDSLTLYDGPNVQYSELARICGQSGERSIAVYKSSGSYMTLQFTTDGSANNYKGFRASYMPSCEMYCTTLRGTVLSTNFPSPYNSNEDRTWEVTVPSGYAMFLHVVHADIECIHDECQVLELSEIVMSFCDMPVPNFYYSSTNSLTITFTTDPWTVGTGFRINYLTVLK